MQRTRLYPAQNAMASSFSAFTVVIPRVVAAALIYPRSDMTSTPRLYVWFDLFIVTRNLLLRDVGSDLQSDWFAGIPAKCDNSLVGMCPGLPLSAAEGVAPRGYVRTWLLDKLNNDEQRR